MVGEAGFHRGRNADRAVDSDEIVIGKVQGERGVVVLPFLAESVCQAREAANLHSHGEVLALDVRRANLLGIGLADDWDHLRADYFGGRVAALFRGGSIHLDELREIDASPKTHGDRIDVSLETVCRDLKVSRRGFVELFDECLCVAGRALPRCQAKTSLLVRSIPTKQ